MPTVLSVIIGAVGNVELTRACIQSVREFSLLKPEIVLIDNGSTPAESVELASLGADVVIYSPVMLGYPKAMNAGVRAASGSFVCLMNNDAQVTQRGWDARLITLLDMVPSAEIIGPYTDFVFSPGQQAAAPGAQDELLETNRLAFVCVVMRADLFERVGFLDEAYGLGNWEDTDLCMRVRQQGGRMLIDPGVFVRHVGHQTMCKLPQFGELLDTNRRLFMKKWKDALYETEAGK
jgi:O-antigen biosynthesis protein